jgi:hypothetical protein
MLDSLKTFLPVTSKIALLLWLAIFPAAAQTNVPRPVAPQPATNKISSIELAEQLRARCIEGRRTICGKILRIFPTGLLVESGYTNLLREPLTKSWFAPGTVTASRATNLVESKEPGAICIGTIFISDLPRGKPHQYDYVMLTGYPDGEFGYTSVGTIQKTVRAFSANLDKAVKANFSAEVQKRAQSGQMK